MIAQITGTVQEVGDNSVLLKVGDICYEVLVPSSVVSGYRKKDKPVKNEKPSVDTFFTIQYIEGSSGHGKANSCGWSGSGAKSKRIFSALYQRGGYRLPHSAPLPAPAHKKIAGAIERSDLPTLQKLPPIGKRTAGKNGRHSERPHAEIRHWTSPSPVHPPEEDLRSEVMQVLRQIGYAEDKRIR